MIIKGENLHVGKLNIEDGNVKIEGIINGINYSDKDLSQKGILSGNYLSDIRSKIWTLP